MTKKTAKTAKKIANKISLKDKAMEALSFDKEQRRIVLDSEQLEKGKKLSEILKQIFNVTVECTKEEFEVDGLNFKKGDTYPSVKMQGICKHCGKNIWSNTINNLVSLGRQIENFTADVGEHNNGSCRPDFTNVKRYQKEFEEEQKKAKPFPGGFPWFPWKDSGWNPDDYPGL